MQVQLEIAGEHWQTQGQVISPVIGGFGLPGESYIVEGLREAPLGITAVRHLRLGGGEGERQKFLLGRNWITRDTWQR